MRNEKDFQAAVQDAAHLLGWLTYHTYDSRHSAPGFPDLVLVRERVLFRELKTDKGRVTAAQQHWIDRLSAAGADAGVWRPADWEQIMGELQYASIETSPARMGESERQQTDVRGWLPLA